MNTITGTAVKNRSARWLYIPKTIFFFRNHILLYIYLLHGVTLTTYIDAIGGVGHAYALKVKVLYFVLVYVSSNRVDAGSRVDSHVGEMALDRKSVV